MTEREALLIHLARGLADGIDIRVELTADEWSWNVATRTLRIGRRALATHGLESCAGLVAHEIGHCAISGYHGLSGRLRPADLPGPVWRILLNVLEDPRVEGWMMRSFPGVQAWIASLSRDMLARGDQVSMPLWTLQFYRAALHEWMRGWVVDAAAMARLPSEIARALAASRSDRRAYAETWPAVDGCSRQPKPLAVAASTQVALAFAVQVGAVLVELRALEVVDLAGRIDGSTLQRVVEEALAGEDVLRCAAVLKVAKRSPIGSGPTTPRQLDLARELIKFVEQSQLTSSNEVPRLFVETSEGQPSLSQPSVDPEEAEMVRHLRSVAKGRIRSQTAVSEPKDTSRAVRQVVRALEGVFPPEQDPGWLRGFASGRRIDLRQAMQREIRPEAASRLWQRRADPRKPDAAVLLLVDLSGSMRHSGKVEAAVFATSACAQALRLLGIPCAVVGFQDRVIPIAAFDEPWSQDLAQRIGEMRLEVIDARPNGHNHSRNNDDGPCLLEAAATLAHRVERQRVLVVVSDGRPAGVRSGPQDLHAAVAKLLRQGHMTLAAIGLGPGTRHVADFYPSARAEVPVADFPKVLGTTLVARLRVAAGDRAA